MNIMQLNFTVKISDIHNNINFIHLQIHWRVTLDKLNA